MTLLGIACACIVLVTPIRRCKAGAATASGAPTHGVAAGEVTPRSAIVWARCAGQATLTVALHGGRQPERVQQVEVIAAHDFTGKVAFTGLAAATRYEYRAWCGAAKDTAVPGWFHTPPQASATQPVRFVWSGDVGGQNACRDAAEGYTAFDHVAAQAPDFFVALGDMIYADVACLPRGRYTNAQVPGPPAPAVDVAGYWAHWKYNRDDAHLQRCFAAVPYYPIWDDHEISSDAGPTQDILPAAPGRHLLPIALQAYVDYQPLTPPADAPTRLYRSARWGRHLELFFLDTRQYRDDNGRPDDPQHPKTMLGAEQRQWLRDGITHSDATWKIVVSGVPLSVPTGKVGRRDGWANYDGTGGFEYEALGLLRTWQRVGVHNLIWITTDIHFAEGFRYTPFADAPAFHFYEFTSGPLNAGVYRREEIDPTLGPERLFIHGVPAGTTIGSFADAKQWFNFGRVDVAANGAATVRIIDGNGRTVWQNRLAPERLRTPRAPAR